MIATKEQEEYIRTNIEKAMKNCNDANDGWYYSNVQELNVDLRDLDVIYAKLPYLDLVNLTKNDYDLVMGWAEDV